MDSIVSEGVYRDLVFTARRLVARLAPVDERCCVCGASECLPSCELDALRRALSGDDMMQFLAEFCDSNLKK